MKTTDAITVMVLCLILGMVVGVVAIRMMDQAIMDTTCQWSHGPHVSAVATRDMIYCIRADTVKLPVFPYKKEP